MLGRAAIGLVTLAIIVAASATQAGERVHMKYGGAACRDPSTLKRMRDASYSNNAEKVSSIFADGNCYMLGAGTIVERLSISDGVATIKTDDSIAYVFDKILLPF